jgi:hypothetical protein
VKGYEGVRELEGWREGVRLVKAAEHGKSSQINKKKLNFFSP